MNKLVRASKETASGSSEDDLEKLVPKIKRVLKGYEVFVEESEGEYFIVVESKASTKNITLDDNKSAALYKIMMQLKLRLMGFGFQNNRLYIELEPA